MINDVGTERMEDVFLSCLMDEERIGCLSKLTIDSYADEYIQSSCDGSLIN